MATPTGVSGATSVSASGPCTASKAVASEMSRSRTFAPRFCATTCAQSVAMLAAFTTSMSRSSKRYTRQSSTKVPCSVRSAEYWACPGRSAPTSLHVTRCTKALRSGPVTSNSPMWDTSNTPTASRTAVCSAAIPPRYVTGISYPPNGTILAPRLTWMSWSGVRFRAWSVTLVSDKRRGIARGWSTLAHQRRKERLLDVQPVLGLVPDARLRALDHLGRDFLAPMRGEAVQEDGRGIGELHQLGVHRVAAERVAARLRFALLPHRGPNVGVDDVGARHRLLGHFRHLNAGAGLLRPIEDAPARLVSFRAGQPQLEAEQLRRLDPAVRHVVAVTHPGDPLPLPPAQRLPHGEQVGQHLARVGQVGEAVDLVAAQVGDGEKVALRHGFSPFYLEDVAAQVFVVDDLGEAVAHLGGVEHDVLLGELRELEQHVLE